MVILKMASVVMWCISCQGRGRESVSSFGGNHTRSLGALGITVLLHLVVLVFAPLPWSPLRPPPKVYTVKLQMQKPRKTPQKRPKKRKRLKKRKRPKKRRPKPKKRRKTKRKTRRKVRRQRTRKRKRRARRKRRLAMAVPRPPARRPQRRTKPPKPTPRTREPRRPKTRRKPNYRALDLRPDRLPNIPGLRPSAPRSRGKRPSKNRIVWGDKQFAKNMQAYHQRFIEDLKDKRGLVDMFFGTATTVIDRCMESWFQGNLTKHLTKKELIGWYHWSDGMPHRKPQWRGTFTVSWNRQGRPTVKLTGSRGLRKLDRLIYKTARRCAKRMKIPSRLKGKRIWMKMSTSTLAYYRLKPSDLIGIHEVRNPQTGAIELKFTRYGSVHVSSNTLILRQKIN